MLMLRPTAGDDDDHVNMRKDGYGSTGKHRRADEVIAFSLLCAWCSFWAKPQSEEHEHENQFVVDPQGDQNPFEEL